MLRSEMTTDAIWVWWSSHTSCMFVRSGCGEKNKYPSKAPFLGLRDIVTRFLMETRHGARRKAQPTVRGTLGITKLVGRLPPYSDIWNDGATSKLTHGFTQAGKPMKFQPEFFLQKWKSVAKSGTAKLWSVCVGCGPLHRAPPNWPKAEEEEETTKTNKMRRRRIFYSLFWHSSSHDGLPCTLRLFFPFWSKNKQRTSRLAFQWAPWHLARVGKTQLCFPADALGFGF